MVHRAIYRLQNHRHFLANQLAAARSLPPNSHDRCEAALSLMISLELSILELDRALIELSHISPPVPDNGNWVET